MNGSVLTQIGRAAGNLPGEVLDWLLPRHCLMCGLPSGAGNLCPPCAGDLPRAISACALCGLELEGENDGICGECLQHPPPWNRVVAALLYRFPVDVLVQRFKFSRNMACGNALARELEHRLLSGHNVREDSRPDVIVPVPLHHARHAKRSFNQSDVVARHLGRRFDIPVENRLLSRVRRTHPQSGLDARSRRKNTRGAFHCHYPRAKGIRHAALLDDVMTTGATLEACTRELKRSGIRDISIWVVARAPP